MVIEKTFKLPIFGNKIKVVIFDNLEEIRNKYHIVGNPIGCTIEYADKAIIAIPSGDLFTLIHECEHAKNITMKYIGQIPNSDNDELDAYLLTYICDRAKDVMDKHIASKC